MTDRPLLTRDRRAPVLGVAGPWGTAEIELAHRFDALHQLIYARGGIRPSNAAVEEVAKLVLAQLWRRRQSASDVDVATAYANALADPELVAVDPSGRVHPIWPRDEPFRLTEPAVLAAATALVAEIVGEGRPAIADPLGTAFDALLAGRYDHAGGLGTYLTPSGIARTMAEVAIDLLDKQSTVDGPGYGDPCCGTGRFLVAMHEALHERGDSLARRLLAAGPFGADQSPSSVAKARVNMLLYGIRHPLVWTVRDSIVDADVASFEGRVPMILTNPPFGDAKYDDPAGLALTAQAVPRLGRRTRIDPALAFVVRSARLLAPGGVLGVVLPDGIVASPTFSELLDGQSGLDIHVAANVSLPTVTFALSGTVAKTSAVFLRRGVRPRHVALARVRHVGYVTSAGRPAADPAGNELPAIPGLVRSGLATAASTNLTVTVASQAPLVSIVATDSLRSYDPARLDPAALEARADLLECGGIELRELLRPRRVPTARAVSSPYVSVLHVDDVGAIDWHAANTHAPTTRGPLARAGDVIVSLLNPATLRAAVLREDAQVSGEFGVFRAAVDPYAILGLLHTEPVRAQLRPLGRGTSSSRRRIHEADVLALIVPKLAEPALAELGRAIRHAIDQIDHGRATLRATFDPPPSPRS